MTDTTRLLIAACLFVAGPVLALAALWYQGELKIERKQ